MTMKIEKYVVILSSENGDKTHLKMSVNRESEIVEIHLDEHVKTRGGTLYVIGEEITKQQLYNAINDYKVRLCANNDIDLMLNIGEKVYVGSTGRTPKIRTLKSLVDRFEKDLEMQSKLNGEKGENDVVDRDGFAIRKDGEKHLDKTGENGVEIGCENQEKNTSKISPQNYTENTFEKSCFRGGELCGTDCEKSSENYAQNADAESAKNSGESVKKMSAESDIYPFIQKDDDLGGKGGNGGSHQQGARGERKEDNIIFAFDSVRFDGSNFYLSVKPQLDEIFVCYPEEELLNNLVPNSKWAHISTPDGYYVVGLVLDGDSVSYICYGVPSTDKNMPPQEIADLAVWLSDGGSEGKGYWLIYQDALTGKCLK